MLQTTPGRIRPTRLWQLLLCLALPLLVYEPALYALPSLGAPAMLPGDAARAQAAEVQSRPDLAAGDSGYLVVWTEERSSSLTGFGLTDVYAARLDAAGTLVDAEPILVSTAEHRQTGARVAWDGSAWLVVFRNERPTPFYLEEDVVGVRVSAAGEVIDATPIVLAGSVADKAGDPDVSAAADGWAVVWPQFNATGVRGVRGCRVTSDGIVLDPGGIELWYDNSNTYANGTRIEWDGEHHLVVWTRSGTQLSGLRLDADLQPVDTAPFLVGNGLDAEVAAGGGGFYVVFVHAVNVNQEEARGTRVSAGGQVLDGAGVSLSSLLFISDLSPAVAWNGDGWTTAFADDGTGSQTFDFDLALRHVGTDGQPLGDAPTLVDAGESYAVQPQVAARPGGGVQIVWQREPPSGVTYDVAALQADPSEGLGTRVDVSLGLPRQLDVYAADAGPAGTRLLVYRSQVSGETRVLGQRFDAAGQILDDEPVVLFTGAENGPTQPRAAGTGDTWLVVWQDDAGILGRRFDATLQPLDAEPRLLMDNHEDPAVAALGDTFLVAGCEIHFFNEPQRWLSTARVGNDGAILDAVPVLVSGGFERSPRLAAVGGRWLLVWESQGTHDSPGSTVDLAWVGAGGGVESQQTISGQGYGDAPDVAVNPQSSDPQAFVVWHDNSEFGNADVEGRAVHADGTLEPVLSLISEPRGQVAPRIDVHGDGWLVSWLDGRHLADLSEQRPDVWAARLDAAGTVLDGGGFAVALTPLAELGAEVAGFDGHSLLLYSAQPEEAPAGHRVVVRSLSSVPEGLIFSDDFEGGAMTSWQ